VLFWLGCLTLGRQFAVFNQRMMLNDLIGIAWLLLSKAMCSGAQLTQLSA
jgi:hypothetical protein